MLPQGENENQWLHGFIIYNKSLNRFNIEENLVQWRRVLGKFDYY